MIIPVEVKTIGKLKIFVKYSDGLDGEISLSKHQADPGYKQLLDDNYFKTVKINNKSHDICWDNGITLCKNAVYKQLELKQLAKKLKLNLDKF